MRPVVAEDPGLPVGQQTAAAGLLWSHATGVTTIALPFTHQPPGGQLANHAKDHEL